MSPRYTYELATVHVSMSSERIPEYLDTPAGDPAVAGDLILSILRNHERHDADVEHFGMLAVDGRHYPTGFKVLTNGTRTQAPVDPAKVFRTALALDAAGIIVFHTHPSGQLEPSRDDMDLTRRLAQAGDLIGIGVYDHFILTLANGGRWLSLRRSRPGLFANNPIGA